MPPPDFDYSAYDFQGNLLAPPAHPAAQPVHAPAQPVHEPAPFAHELALVPAISLTPARDDEYEEEIAHNTTVATHTEHDAYMTSASTTITSTTATPTTEISTISTATTSTTTSTIPTSPINDDEIRRVKV